MNQKRKAKILFYVIAIQLISILFALLIEKVIDLVVKKFCINLDMEILYLFLILILLAGFMYVVYRQIYSLLLFDSISNQIATSNERTHFYKLLKKVQNNEVLTDYQKTKLQSYIDKSPLPHDFLSKQTTSFNISFWQKILLFIVIVYLYFSLKKYINEHHTDNEPVS